MELRIRHVISANGRLPNDPSTEPVSGVVASAVSIATDQQRAGHAVEIWGWDDGHAARRSRWQGMEIWSSPDWGRARFGRWDVRWLAPVAVNSLMRPGVDILHAHVDPNLLYLPKARARVLHLHTPVPEPFPPAYGRLLRRADAVICCSNFLRDRFLLASGHRADRTYVVHNGADARRFDASEGGALRAAWGFEDDDVVILFSGAIVPEKGVAELVTAFERVRKAVPRARLAVVGSSQLWDMVGQTGAAAGYESAVRRAAEGMGVRFVGRLASNEMPAAYLASDVVVVPSVWDDPHPIVVCEAMAAGRPVVASRAGGITETVEHGRTGLLVAPGDAVELSTAISTLALDDALRTRMGIAARERAELFTWRAAASRTESIYRDILGNGLTGDGRRASRSGDEI